jgi:hypothetical protein
MFLRIIRDANKRSRNVDRFAESRAPDTMPFPCTRVRPSDEFNRIRSAGGEIILPANLENPREDLVAKLPVPFATLGALLLAVGTAAWAQTPKVTINASVTIVESAQESAPVRRATKDLLNDFTKVFGQAPRLVGGLAEAGTVAILIAQNSNLPAGVECATSTDMESFAFSIAGAGFGPTHRRVVCLTGADMRGTIFAIYQFSQIYLGVDPMYLWTDKQPAKRVSIPLPADFAHVYPSPVFKYRGFFPNDEDLLTGWIPPAKGEQTGISLKTWDNIFETTLRLKGNMIVPGTWIFPDDAQVQAASERGLIVNQHHAIPLGVNVARWPRDVPYNFSTHPEILERAWTNAAATYKPGEEILWRWACAVCLTQAMRRSIQACRTMTPCWASASAPPSPSRSRLCAPSIPTRSSSPTCGRKARG